jgi:hypothetical protein
MTLRTNATDASSTELDRLNHTNDRIILPPLALSAFDSARAKEKFPDYRLTQLVLARLDMTDSEATVFADFIDAMPLGPNFFGLAPFYDHLRASIERFGLGALFGNDGPGKYHHTIRPCGYDYHADAVDPAGMERWRAGYRAMTSAQQMFAASIIWLYRGKKDNCWLRRVPCTWHAADAIDEMRRQDMLADWARLVLLYPGW